MAKVQAKTKRAGNLFLDILLRIEEKNEEDTGNDKGGSEASPTGSGGSAPPAHHRCNFFV